MKKWIICLTFIALVILAFAYNFLAKNQEINPKNENMPKTLKIGQITLNVEIADTEAERVQGLSGREKLGESEGLLFVFDREGYYSFWMKDMKFPIDMAWLDKNKRIIYIEKNVSPETYPKIFYAMKDNIPIPSLYVLETNANFFENSKIKIGDFAEF
jgi:hypothetical protein